MLENVTHADWRNPLLNKANRFITRHPLEISEGVHRVRTMARIWPRAEWESR